MGQIMDLDDWAAKARKTGREFLREIAKKHHWPVRDGTRGEVHARVDWGRWLADCPFCRGAELVSREDKEFYCLSCGMAANDHHPMHVIFPENMQQIESELEPLPAKWQNWMQGVEA